MTKSLKHYSKPKLDIIDPDKANDTNIAASRVVINIDKNKI